MVQTPYQAPNANAYAERFVRSTKHECLNRVIPLGERHLRRTVAEFVEHYHGERLHQGLGNELMDGRRSMASIGFAVDNGSAGSSIITVAPRDDTRGSISTARPTSETLRPLPGGSVSTLVAARQWTHSLLRKYGTLSSSILPLAAPKGICTRLLTFPRDARQGESDLRDLLVGTK